MHDFKTGDKVIRKAKSILQPGVVTISRVRSTRIEIKGFKGFWCPELFRLATIDEINGNMHPLYSNTTRFRDLSFENKEALVSAFMKGEAIELRRSNDVDWNIKNPMDKTGSVGFSGNYVYRLQPLKTARELKIEELEDTMVKLAREIADLRKLKD